MLKNRIAVAALSAAVLFTACKKGEEDHGHGHKAHWGYSGETGPEHWGKLEGSFEACALGKIQSPIDISEPFEKITEALDIQYKASSLKVLNNGHTIQVNTAEGSVLNYKGKVFKLAQYHFHTPSENLISGKAFPMEVHLVHKSDDGELAVIGVMMEEGSEHAGVASVWKIMPAAEGEAESADSVNPADLLPAGKSYYNFSGSLTTPPCSEGVNWFVMAEPIQVSKAQIEAFKAMFPMNARPVQSRGDRPIKAAN